MTHLGRYDSRVKVGNWNENLTLDEVIMKRYLEKKERGDLEWQKIDCLKENILKPVTLSVSTGAFRIGDVVMLVNPGGENRERSVVGINADVSDMKRVPLLGIRAPCGVSAGKNSQPCARTAFIICSVDGSPEGSMLHFEQNFALRTTSGFAMELYLTSDVKTFNKFAKKSGLQQVTLEKKCTFLSWWKVVHCDPQERLESEGLSIPADMKFLIVHCKTNQGLAVLGDKVLRTMYGKEYEVTAHTFLDSHKVELDPNHWFLCTSGRAPDDLALPDRPNSAAGGNPELTVNETLEPQLNRDAAEHGETL